MRKAPQARIFGRPVRADARNCWRGGGLRGMGHATRPRPATGGPSRGGGRAMWVTSVTGREAGKESG